MLESILIWAPQVLQHLDFEALEAKENQRKMLERLDEIVKMVGQLDIKLDEQVLREARTAVRHLSDALNSDLKETRDHEFRLARQGFAHLTELDPSGSTGSKSGDIDNRFLICLGYWGNHHYFNLTGEKRNAAIQVYECTEQYPQFGMLLFSSTFFSKNFAALIGVATAEVKTLCERLAELERKNVGDKVRYYLRQALQLGTTGVVGAGAAVFAIATRNAGVFHGGMQAASQLFKTLDPGFLQLSSVGEVRKEISDRYQKIETLSQELLAECKLRNASLRKVRLQDLISPTSD